MYTFRIYYPQAGAVYHTILYNHVHPQCSMLLDNICMQNRAFSKAHLWCCSSIL